MSPVLLFDAYRPWGIQSLAAQPSGLVVLSFRLAPPRQPPSAAATAPLDLVTLLVSPYTSGESAATCSQVDSPRH
eukprot:5852897-Amphidinium_carterae.1